MRLEFTLKIYYYYSNAYVDNVIMIGDDSIPICCSSTLHAYCRMVPYYRVFKETQRNTVVKFRD